MLRHSSSEKIYRHVLHLPVPQVMMHDIQGGIDVYWRPRQHSSSVITTEPHPPGLSCTIPRQREQLLKQSTKSDLSISE